MQDTSASRFEAAVDALVAGDMATLQALLAADPALPQARSQRPHHSTLLHYASANGVEDERQRTPPNIVELTRLLLEAGADVHAESEAYGGRSTTLMLTGTSCHPEDAGVQIPLLTLLLERGARMDGGTVNACLRNGRGAAAVFLASRGAPLDLEGAAGVGHLDLVQELFETATPQQRLDGFAWACEFGHTPVARWLLDRGIPIDAPLRSFGQTGLHWAAYGGHLDLVRMLLERNAPVHLKDATYDGTPLDWLLHQWSVTGRTDESYYEAAALLRRAGTPYHPLSKIQSDPRMRAALADPA